MAPLLVMTTVPSQSVGEKIAAALVEAKLAACVHILPMGTSIYRWQGKIQHTSESTLLIKSRAECQVRLESVIQELHPYEIPEIISLSINSGLEPYLSWIESETAPANL